MDRRPLRTGRCSGRRASGPPPAGCCCLPSPPRAAPAPGSRGSPCARPRTARGGVGCVDHRRRVSSGVAGPEAGRARERAVVGAPVAGSWHEAHPTFPASPAPPRLPVVPRRQVVRPRGAREARVEVQQLAELGRRGVVGLPIRRVGRQDRPRDREFLEPSPLIVGKGADISTSKAQHDGGQHTDEGAGTRPCLSAKRRCHWPFLHHFYRNRMRDGVVTGCERLPPPAAVFRLSHVRRNSS